MWNKADLWKHNMASIHIFWLNCYVLNLIFYRINSRPNYVVSTCPLALPPFAPLQRMDIFDTLTIYYSLLNFDSILQLRCRIKGLLKYWWFLLYNRPIRFSLCLYVMCFFMCGVACLNRGSWPISNRTIQLPQYFLNIYNVRHCVRHFSVH